MVIETYYALQTALSGYLYTNGLLQLGKLGGYADLDALRLAHQAYQWDIFRHSLICYSETAKSLERMSPSYEYDPKDDPKFKDKL